jgi:hypothetical protein
MSGPYQRGRKPCNRGTFSDTSESNNAGISLLAVSCLQSSQTDFKPRVRGVFRCDCGRANYTPKRVLLDGAPTLTTYQNRVVLPIYQLPIANTLETALLFQRDRLVSVLAMNLSADLSGRNGLTLRCKSNRTVRYSYSDVSTALTGK